MTCNSWNGLVLIDKPPGCTSHDVVNRWRRLANTRRVGHLGTLDPMATGLLVLLTGTATRLAQFFGDDEKTYRAEITLGKTSDTYDAQGDVSETGGELPSVLAVERELRAFEGTHLQVPPPVSAKKVNGIRAYKLARNKVEVELAPVEVHIRELAIEAIEAERICIQVTCSTGTYIRSIAHDLGQRLGCGALLSALRRTRAGGWAVSEARTLDQLAQLSEENRLPDAVIPSAQLLPGFPNQHVDAFVEAAIRQGRDFRVSPFVVRPGCQYVKAVSNAGELVAIGRLVVPNLYHPMAVL